MSIRKKGNRWEVRLRNGSGRRIEHRLPTGAKRADAQALEVALKRRLIESETGRTNYTLIEALERWLVDAQQLKSWEKDLRYRYNVLREIAGTYKLREILEVVLLVKRRGKEQGLKAASINRYLAILKRICTLAWQWGWIEHPIAARIELLPGETRRNTFATVAQLRKLMAASDARLRDLILIAAMTGMRRNELLQVTPEMIEGNAIVLSAAVTKTNRARVIPLPAEAKKVIKRALPSQLSASNVRKLYDAARKAAGLTHIRWHDLRRSYGTWLLRGGASLADVRDLLGHSDVKTTSIYLATARQDLTNAVANLPKLGEVRGKKEQKPSAEKRKKYA